MRLLKDPPEGVQDHGEEDKLAEEGDHEGGRGYDLSQEEEEHGEREKNVDGETDLEGEGKIRDWAVYKMSDHAFSPESEGR